MRLERFTQSFGAWLVALLVLITVSADVYSREQKPKPDLPPIDALDGARLDGTIAKRDLAQARLDNLVLQFISQNPEARGFREEAARLNGEVQVLAQALLKKHGLDPAKYDIDPKQLKFVERP